MPASPWKYAVEELPAVNAIVWVRFVYAQAPPVQAKYLGAGVLKGFQLQTTGDTYITPSIAKWKSL